jgi:hypothetical protein
LRPFVWDASRVPLDEFLPEFHFSEVHSTLVAAPPERTLAAAREVTSRDMPAVRALMAVRRLGRVPSKGPVIDEMLRNGFFVLADRDDELVLGVVGRFWAFDSGITRIGPEDFERYHAPNQAKAVMDFHVEATPGGCLLSTETRIQGTDEDARRSFGRYWRIIHPGSALIRRVWLRAVRRRAERG